MAVVKSEVKDEVRVIFVDMARFVDGAVIEQCYREIVDMLDKTEESNVLLHFGHVTFMSSAALGMLIRVKKKCTEFKITLKLCNISPDIGQVFKITGLDKVFDIHADAADAMVSFKASGTSFFRKHRQSRHDLT
jgi:anti-sigma B factor antagonist